MSERDPNRLTVALSVTTDDRDVLEVVASALNDFAKSISGVGGDHWVVVKMSHIEEETVSADPHKDRSGEAS